MILSRRAFVSGGAAALAATALPGRLFAAATSGLTPAAMQADLDLLLRAYETVHPGLLRYLPQGGFGERIAAAKLWAARDRSLPEFFTALARLTASVRCGHSHPNPANQSRAAREALFSGRNRLPFSFRWIDQRMIVTGARGGTPVLPAGSEVLTLDGVSPRHMLTAMLPLARADGSNNDKRIAQLGIASRDRYAAFDMFRPMLFSARADGTMQLQVRDPNGQRRIVTLAALSEEQLRPAPAPENAPMDWSFDIRSDGIGLLTMKDWVTYRSQWDWRAYLDQVVDRLIEERSRGFIIDIRGNEGGTECGWHLLERLVEREVARPAFIQKVRFRQLPADLVEPLDTWDPSFRDWGSAAVGPDTDGFYRLERPNEGDESIVPRGRRFAGPVAVLINASCSSATFQFADAIQRAGLATLVGEGTGGSRRGINGGAYFFVRLPGTGLEVDLPIIGYFPQQSQPDAGVRPERLVAVTTDDIAAGRDRQLDTALRAVGARAS